VRAYLTGLCLPGERTSIEPMAARVDPRHVRARHQSVHHFVANAPWEAAAVLRIVREWVLEPMARHGPVTAWILDETAFPKNAYSGEAEHPDPPMVKRVWISRAGGPRGETEGSPAAGVAVRGSRRRASGVTVSGAARQEAAPYALIVDPRRWTPIAAAPCPAFRGWRYLESPPGGAPRWRSGIPTKPARVEVFLQELLEEGRDQALAPLPPPATSIPPPPAVTSGNRRSNALITCSLPNLTRLISDTIRR
jgi:hypothetical protein